MLRKCQECGGVLNSYNLEKWCFPCQKKIREKIIARMVDLPYLDLRTYPSISVRARVLIQEIAK
jgi:hypothetical protein